MLNSELEKLVKNKRILVTGGTGSIGSEIVRQLLQYSPTQIRVFSRDEHKQHWMARQYEGNTCLRFLIGDVRDQRRVEKAVEDVNLVFHAAALKHVPVCEYNPFEAIRTNVQGTQHVVDAAWKAGVEKVVSISTDKAAAPVSVMGATKLLAEKIVTSSVYYQRKQPTICSAVRFGNVLDSRGSVVEVFKQQIENDDSVTITDEKMRRFVMTIQEATLLVLTAATIMKGSEVFVLKMPVVRIAELAKALVQVYAPMINKDPKNIKYIYSGIRPGEKLDELLMTKEEARFALEREDMFVLCPFLQFPELGDLSAKYPRAKPAERLDYTSQDVASLAFDDILPIVKTIAETWKQST